jgi:hypothetical protein
MKKGKKKDEQLEKKLKKQERRQRKASFDKIQEKITLKQTWELRFFFYQERSSIFTQGKAKKRTDIYIVCTDAIGLKLRHESELELKILVDRKKRGAENWAKYSLPGSFSTNNFSVTELKMAMEAKGILEDAKFSEKVTAALEKLNQTGVHFITIEKEVYQTFDCIEGISTESTILYISRNGSDKMKCYSNCLEVSGMTTAKPLYKKCKDLYIPESELGVSIQASSFPQLVLQYFDGGLNSLMNSTTPKAFAM